ncbi:hypothetical protein PA25_25280 [Pseudoalteromonas sp. A25]|uniref:ABC transporter substrate-binding protein n=1 Tax=Pseudoalteromonas sp. A25 TaxID=116092 RepID=UPI0012608295|nr:ABC transporter substrate-binding protein [Pseudoalteromonas sp. A25]BBN82543.1 hypothetical protein PA25_25280 [Pseudoalteromonas sp. A25]
MGSDKDITIGLLAPLSGVVSLYGEEISNAAKIACDEINEAGGILGKKLKLVIADDGSVPQTAVPAAKQLVHDHHCDAIIGNLLSSSRIAVNLDVAEVEKIPYLSFSFYEGSIKGRYFFSFAALPNQQIDKMIPYMAERYGMKFFFAGANYEWPRGSIDAAKHALAKIGGEIVGEEYLQQGATDFRSMLYRLYTSGADVFVPYFAGTDQVNLLTQFCEMKLKDRMAVVMGHFDEVMAASMPNNIKTGFYSSNTYFMSVPTKENKHYLERLSTLESVNGLLPNGNGGLTNFGEGTYLCVKAFAQAVKQANSLNTDAIISALENVEVQSPQGHVKMDPKTHHAYVNNYLSKCNQSGEFEIVESFGLIEPLIPPRYKHHYEQSEFDEFTSNEEPKLNIASWQLIKIFSYDEVWSGIEQQKTVCDLPEYIRTSLTIDKASFKEHFYNKEPMFMMGNSTDGYQFRVKVIPLEGNDKSNLAIYESKGDYTPQLSDQILANADVAVIATDETGHVIVANESSTTLFGYVIEELIGLHIIHLIPPRFREKHNSYFKQFLQAKDTQRKMGSRQQIYGYRKDGSEFPATASIAKTSTGGSHVLTVTIVDISEQKEQHEQLEWQANHDSLTHLPNRSLFHRRLSSALRRSATANSKVALLFIDLDHFKSINDIFGHDFGDMLLVSVSNRLLETINPGDTLSRFGGDEFVVLCDNVADPEEIETLAQKINRRLKQPFTVLDQIVYLSCSIGFSLGFGSSDSANTLVRKADTAMYEAKDKGRDAILGYNPQLDSQMKNKFDIAHDLRQAINDDTFSLVIQPIVDLSCNKVVAGEVLLRCTTPQGSISPEIFIPVAESIGLINIIGQWVINNAFQALSKISNHIESGQLKYISINISNNQLCQPEFIELMTSELRKYTINPQHILLEITETSIMKNEAHVKLVLAELASIGFKIAIDDFGTGYTCFNQLLELPINCLKIDKTFVDKIETDEKSPILIHTISSLANFLGFDVITEGVETKEQLKTLQYLGCYRIQGFLFYKPMSFQEFDALLNTGESTNINFNVSKD